MNADPQVQKTADAIRRLVREIADLAAADIPRQAFFAEFIAKSARAIDAAGAAVWIGRSGRFNLIADVDLDSSQFSSNPRQGESIRAALRWVEEHGRPLIIAPLGPDALDDQHAAGIPNYTPMAFFYVPIKVTDTVVGIIQVWQQPGRDPKTFRPFIEFLIAVTRHAETYLESRHLETVVRETQRLEGLLLLTERLASAASTEHVGLNVVALARELVGADRLTLLGVADRRCRALAVSGQSRVERRSETVRAIENLGRAVIGASDARAYRRPAPSRDPSKSADGDASVRRYFLAAPYDLVVFMPLKDGGHVVGVLAAEYPADDARPNDEDLAALQSVARQVGPTLAHALQRDAMPLRRTARFLAALRPRPRKRPLALIAALALLILAAAVIPVRPSIDGHCTVWPVDRAAVVAQEEGTVAAVLVAEGQRVRAGDPLVRLDSPSLETALEVARADVDKWQAEAQAREAAGDLSAARIASIRAEKAAGEVAHLRSRLDALTLRSPMDGVVVTHDAAGQLGKFVARGGRVLDVAELDTWEVVIEVPEKDILRVEQAIADAGEHGMPVHFLLASRPDHPLSATIAGPDAISQVARPVNGRNVFLVRARVADVAVAGDLRIGYEGRARIDAPAVSALRAAVNPAIDYVRYALF